jgi:hypothetical protein
MENFGMLRALCVQATVALNVNVAFLALAVGDVQSQKFSYISAVTK